MIVNELEILQKSFSPLTAAQLAKQLNLDSDFEDNSYLEYLLEAGVDWCEGRTNSFITDTTAKLEIFDFTGDLVFIEKGGFKNLESVKINGTAINDYKVIRRIGSTIIKLNNSISTPSYLEVVFKAGGNKIKKNFIHACLIKAADLYDTDRSDYSSGLSNNNTVLRLLNLM